MVTTSLYDALKALYGDPSIQASISNQDSLLCAGSSEVTHKTMLGTPRAGHKFIRLKDTY